MLIVLIKKYGHGDEKGLSLFHNCLILLVSLSVSLVVKVDQPGALVDHLDHISTEFFSVTDF